MAFILLVSVNVLYKFIIDTFFKVDPQKCAIATRPSTLKYSFSAFLINTYDFYDKCYMSNSVDKIRQLIMNQRGLRGVQEHTQQEFPAHRGAKCACRRPLYY